LLKEIDKRLFRSAVGKVRPLQTTDARVPTQPSAPTPLKPSRIHTEKQPLFRMTVQATADLDSFQRPGIPRQLLQKLQHGRLPIQAELDLHGYTQAKAEAILRSFLSDCLTSRLSQVRIIHGKGKGSENGQSILRNPTRSWLQCCSAVLAYASPPARFGGNGVVDVILKRTP